MALLYHHFENGCFMADSQTVLDIRDDLGATMNECREVTEKYRTGRSAYLRLEQLFMRLFAGLNSIEGWNLTFQLNCCKKVTNRWEKFLTVFF